MLVSNMKITAVFVDRDGVLNGHLPGDYVKSPASLILIPGVAAAIRRLNDASIPVIVISNQQGVGKGLMSGEDLLLVTRHLEACLDAEAGAHLDRCYYCTDLKSADSPRRKPEPGMLFEAAQDYGFSLADTVFIGDSATDIAAGAAANVGATILVLSGATPVHIADSFTPPPNHIFRTLANAVDWILEDRE